MGWLRDIVNDVSQYTEPVTKYDPIVDEIGGTIKEAVNTGWGKPLGDEKSGLDVIGAGPFARRGVGGDPNKPEDRAVGRTVGLIAAGYGVSAAAGGSGAAAEGGAVGEDTATVDTFATGAEGSSEGFTGSASGVEADSAANFGSEGFSTVEGEPLPAGTTASGTVGTADTSGGFSWTGLMNGVKSALGIATTVQSLANQRRLTTAQLNARSFPAQSLATTPGFSLPALGIDTTTEKGKAALTGWIVIAGIALLVLFFLSRR